MTPDLVVGASVGTLMGRTRCHAKSKNENDQLRLLAHLTDTFLHVDDKVALTSRQKPPSSSSVCDRALETSPAKCAPSFVPEPRVDVGYPPPASRPSLSTLSPSSS